jgi:hypothetical protein
MLTPLAIKVLETNILIKAFAVKFRTPVTIATVAASEADPEGRLNMLTKTTGNIGVHRLEP